MNHTNPFSHDELPHKPFQMTLHYVTPTHICGIPKQPFTLQLVPQFGSTFSYIYPFLSLRLWKSKWPGITLCKIKYERKKIIWKENKRYIKVYYDHHCHACVCILSCCLLNLFLVFTVLNIYMPSLLV